MRQRTIVILLCCLYLLTPVLCIDVFALGKIAFARNAGTSYDIWTMNDDGTNLFQVTSSPDVEWIPNVSPDGRRIVYANQTLGQWRIVNTDGTNDQLVFEFGPGGNPQYTGGDWSPDGL